MRKTCRHCEARFHLFQNLLKHEAQQHPGLAGRRPIIYVRCEICDQICTERGLARHQWLAHGKGLPHE